YNGSVALTNENYLTTSNSGNTANVATLSPTTINSLNRVTSTVTNASSVSFAAVFGTAVTGVTASNFSVTTTGVSGVTNASIGTPTTSDNITWTVPVSTGTGDGTIQLNLANATGLSKTISTSLPFAGQAYTIDKTPPSISIGAPSLSATNAGPVTYTVTYADANFNSSTLANANVTLNPTGTATASTVNVTGSGLTRTVTISGITGNGTLGISIAAGTATDLAGNSAAAAGPSTTFTVDNVVPTVTIARTDGNPIHDNVLDFQAVFSEAVTGVDASDFTLTTTGGVTSGAISVTPLNSTTYNITVINVNGTGTGRLDLNGSGTGISDAAGNTPAGFTGGEVYTIDQTAPTVSSINIAGTSPTNATSVDYTVTFSEAVTGVDGTDFTVTKTGTANGNVTGVTGSGTTYTVTVGSVTGNGNLRLDLNASGTAIVDGAANPVSAGFTSGQTYTIDTTPATLTSGSYFSNNGFSSQYAKVGDNITLSIGYNEPLQSLAMTIGGNAVSVTPSNGNKNWTGVYTETSSDTEGNVPWTLSATDLAGNVRNYANTDFGTVLTFDKTPPAISISAPTPAIAGSGSATTVTYDVTYADANFNFSNLSTSDITLNTTGTATGTIGLSGSGTSYHVTVSNVTGLGTLGISIGANTAQDIPGNLALASDPSATFLVAKTDATLASLTTTADPLSPTFDTNTLTGYTASVPNSVTTMTVTPAVTDIDATVAVQVNGGGFNSVTSGSASAPLALNEGANTIDVRGTAQDGTTTKTYTLTVTRRAPAQLFSFVFNPGITLHAVAGPQYKNYIGMVDNSVSSVTVTPKVKEVAATITVNNVTVASGATSGSIHLDEGENTITTTVT
ncbi:MAG: cadherin-like beta sandwich domain-containing protein, partial [Mucilaginibacter sp.]